MFAQTQKRINSPADTLEFPDNVHTNKQSGMVMAHSESCLQKE